jgi:hypothetical protein
MRIPAAILLAAATSTVLAAERGEVVRHLEDNSFLIEEAYNQEQGVVHNVTTFMRDRDTGSWVGAFSQEWPVVSEEHQLSFTAPYVSQSSPYAATARGFGDVAINYRYQALSDDARTALAPRLTLLLPTGSTEARIGAGGAGVQVALPASVRLGTRFATHLNVGAGLVPSGRAPDGARTRQVSVFAGGGLIWLLHPRLNLLVEALWSGVERTVSGTTTRADSLVVSPGLRFGIDFPKSGLQVVPGIGVPIGLGPSAGTLSILGYLSFEFPFTSTAPGPGAP